MFSRRYLWLRSVIAVVIPLAAFFAAVWFDQYATTFWTKLAIEVFKLGAAGSAGAVVLFTVAWRLRNELLMLFSYHDSIYRQVKSSNVINVVLALARPALQKETDRLAQLVGAGGLALSRDELGELTKSAFEFCRGPYFGTDKNVPSAFRSIYPLYIEDQFNRPRGRLSEDIRFLIVEPSELGADFDSDPEEFRRFYDQHWEHQIQLLQVNVAQATAAQRKAGLPSVEIGLYEWSYVLFYTVGSTGTEVHVRASQLAGPLANQCRQFLDELVDCAKVLTFRTGRRPTLVNPNDEYRAHLREILAQSR